MNTRNAQAVSFWARAALLVCLEGLACFAAEATLQPQSNADYGSGASAYNLYYPGGVPDVGLFVGQANEFHRNDRAVVRFLIAPYLLANRPVASAVLRFEVGSFTADREDLYEVEVSHLAYDAGTFTAADLVNSRAAVVAVVPVSAAEFQGKGYALDVTAWVNRDIAAGNVYTAFRFRNVTAERNSTGRTGITLGKEAVCSPLPSLSISTRTAD